MFVVSAFAVILEREKVLLCHRRDYDLWNLPGGATVDGETSWHTVVRETREETGLEVRATRLSGVYYKPDNNELSLCFICEIESGNPGVSDEADRVEWFSVANIPINTSPKQVERIRDAIKNHPAPVMRTQTMKSSLDLLQELGQI